METLLTSPLVSRLLERMEDSPSLEGRAICAAELACYYARVGQFEEAESFRLELRQSFGDGRSVKVSVLIMCLEALILYFKDLSPSARDRMVRAKLLSTAWRETRLVAVTSAWLAHIDFNLNQFEAMATSLETCFSAVEADDGSAECRASLVLGDSFLYCNEALHSQRWYERARILANRLGDQAAVGAITYNRAALRVAATRLASLTGLVDDGAVGFVRAEVNSAVNYQAVARLRSLDHLLKFARIGSLMLEKKYSDALPIISALLGASEVPPKGNERAQLEADCVLCLSATGHYDPRLGNLRSISDSEIDQFSADDRALIFSSLATASRLTREVDSERRYLSLTERALKEHATTIEGLSQLLAPYREQADLSQT